MYDPNSTEEQPNYNRAHDNNSENQNNERRGNYTPRNNRYKRNPTPPGERKMYYVALLCPQEIDAQIDEYKDMMRNDYGCEVAAKSPAHITLITPFWMSDGKYKDLVEKLTDFESIITEVSLNMNGFNCFNKRVIFADVEVTDNLITLQEQLETYLKNTGFPFIRESKKPFHPHVTIATRDISEEQFDDAWPKFENLPYSASFSTNALHVMRLVDEQWTHAGEFILK
jgi:2'-5' RNA ligase